MYLPSPMGLSSYGSLRCGGVNGQFFRRISTNVSGTVGRTGLVTVIFIGFTLKLLTCF